MTVLAVWAFSALDGALRAEHSLALLSARGPGGVDDAAVLTWAPGTARPRVRGVHSVALHGAVGGDFWAVLGVVVFLLPALREQDPTRAPGGEDALDGVGVSDAFAAGLRHAVTPGTSALAVLADEDTCAATGDALQVLRPALTRVVLTAEQEWTLRRVFPG